MDDRAFPSGDLGPVDFCALILFWVAWAGEVMLSFLPYETDYVDSTGVYIPFPQFMPKISRVFF
jgi:hypothetical protein